MTEAPGLATATAVDAESRSTALTLARLHLRVGSIALARAEFETLAGRNELDDAGWLDLAESRWRTGELMAAGEAATTVLDRGLDAPLAMLIAAEASFARGRPGEARRFATRAMSAAGGTLDALFAGMPRSSVWPPDPADPVAPAATLFGDDAAESAAAPPSPAAAVAASAAIGADGPQGQHGSGPGPAAVVVGAGAVADDHREPGLWDADAPPAPREPDAVPPAALLDDGLAAIAAGDPERAAMLLGLAVRTGPHLAPSIVDGTMDVTSPSLLLVRGDALRATGHDDLAAEAYARAARALRGDGPAGPTAPGDAADTPAGDVALQSGPTGSNPQ